MNNHQNKIEKLISELCPNGVEFKELSKIASIETGSQLNKTAMFETGNYPVLNGGISPSGFFNDYNTNKDTITISQGGASAGYVNFMTDKFWAGAHCFVIKPIVDQVINKYLYFFLKNGQEKLQNAKLGAGIPGLNKKELQNFRIPIPPLSIQEEIIKVLDNFTELEAELEAELEVRKKQYEYYRSGSFEFNENVNQVTLNSVILSLKTGLNPRKNFVLNTSDAKNYYVTVREINGSNVTFFKKTDRINDEALRLINNRSNLDAGDILFSGTGTIGRTALVKEKPKNWNIKEGVYVIKPNQKVVNSKFLLFFLNSAIAKKQIENKIVGSPVSSIPMAELKKIKIPLPEMHEQEEIVSILNKFDALVNDISIGLPAELKARRKQYEYYRNKLLTFKEYVG